ncbi:MAG: hypothetical protein M1118_09355 [Chloroflexi bacterium]|nr:hypothetical protein [Chloroflexota bacterium]
MPHAASDQRDASRAPPGGGPTLLGRMLTVILDPEPEPDVYYPVTARPASRQERRHYQETRGGEAR